VLGNVLVKIGQRFPAGCGYGSHFVSPRIGPLFAMGLCHSASGFIVSCDGVKIGVE
jgi:hypothetical protein